MNPAPDGCDGQPAGFPLDREERLYFRDSLRAARASVLRDSENFMEIPLLLERLGSFLDPGKSGLYEYHPDIAGIAGGSPLAATLPAEFPQYHRPFDNLYDVVRVARNELVHEGAHARQLTHRAVELALILEDALMRKASKAADFMVHDPEEAHAWEPLSFLRQKMLLNSFTFLPIQWPTDSNSSWRLVSDAALAGFLQGDDGRQRKMSKRLAAAVHDNDVELEKARTCRPDDPVDELVEGMDHRPWLVVDESDCLVGIVSAYDLL